jgi:hypothetical protein
VYDKSATATCTFIITIPAYRCRTSSVRPQAPAIHSTAQHSTAQHSTAQHSTAQHSTAQHSTAQHRHGTAQRTYSTGVNR